MSSPHRLPHVRRRHVASLGLLVGLTSLAGCARDVASPDLAGASAAEQVAASTDLVRPTPPPTPTPTPPGTPGIAYPLPVFPAALALTDAQRDQIRALVEAESVASRPDRVLVGSLDQQIGAARRAGRPADEIAALVAQAAAARARLSTSRAQLDAAVRAVFTPAQRAFLDEQRRSR